MRWKKIEDIFGDIIEQKIRQSIARGEAKNLSGSGKPVNIENFYFLPPEFRFAYTVLKNSGFLNLADDEKAPVSLTSEEMKTVNLSDSSKTIQEMASNSLLNKMTSLDVRPTKYIQEKALNYNIIRDSRRGRFY